LEPIIVIRRQETSFKNGCFQYLDQINALERKPKVSYEGISEVYNGINTPKGKIYFSENEIKRDWAKIKGSSDIKKRETVWWDGGSDGPWNIPEDKDWQEDCDYDTNWIGYISVKLDTLLTKVGAKADVVYVGICSGNAVARRVVDNGLAEAVATYGTVWPVGVLDIDGALLTMQMLGVCKYKNNTKMCEGDTELGWNKTVSKAAADIPLFDEVLPPPTVITHSEINEEYRFYNAPRVVQVEVNAYDRNGRKYPVYQYDYSQRTSAFLA